MHRQRVVVWLSALALAFVAGTIAALLMMAALRALFTVPDDAAQPDLRVLAVGYLVWVLVALTVSAAFLRYMGGRSR